MRTRTTFALARLLGSVADRLAADPTIPPENREAYRETIVSVISCHLTEAFGGEELRFYVPKAAWNVRQARDQRIAAAIAAGEPPARVAKQEQVSERHVRRLRGRIGV